MNTSILALCLCVLLACCSGERLKREITPQDKAIFQQLVQDALEQLRTTYKTIPDFSGKDGKLEYSFTNIRVTSLTTPGVNVVEEGPSALRLSIADAGLSADADWRVSYKFLFRFRTSGGISASVSGLNIAVSATVEDLPDGKVKIGLTNCQATVRDVSIHLRGSLAFALNLFKGKFERKVRDIIPDKICSQVREYILKV